jgi:hypothetical protein
MSRIDFETGDTLGGTVPLLLLHQIRPCRPRKRQRHHSARRLIWIWGLVIAIGAAVFQFIG